MLQIDGSVCSCSVERSLIYIGKYNIAAPAVYKQPKRYISVIRAYVGYYLTVVDEICYDLHTICQFKFVLMHRYTHRRAYSR